MSREEISAALAKRYIAAYGEYEMMANLAKEALREGDSALFGALKHRADLKSSFLDGVKAAAEELGVDMAEFMDSVRRESEGG